VCGPLHSVEMKSLFPFVTIINNFRFACFFFSACSLSVCVCVCVVSRDGSRSSSSSNSWNGSNSSSRSRQTDGQTVRPLITPHTQQANNEHLMMMIMLSLMMMLFLLLLAQLNALTSLPYHIKQKKKIK